MKKKTKLIIASLCTICAAGTISVGGTYALFTSSDDANIAITSGKVNATATIGDLTIYSANPELTSGDEVPGGSDLGVYSHTYYYDDRTTAGTFINGGTATLTDGSLSLDNVAPGDMAKAKFTVTNNSNIDVKYRLVAECTSTDDDEIRFFAALKFTALGQTKTNVKKYYTNWTIWTADDTTRTNVSDIKIEVPLTLGNEYQELSTDIKLSVEMVQGNTYVTDNEDEVIALASGVVQPSATSESGMTDTLLTAGGTDETPLVKTYIPTATPDEVKADGENVEVYDDLVLTVYQSTASSSILIEENEEAKNYEVHLVNQDGDEVTSVNAKIKVYIYIGEGKEIQRVYHKDTLVEDYTYEDGYVVFETSDFSPFSIVMYDSTVEATHNGVVYASLTEAIAAAEDGDTVIVRKDIETTEGYNVTANNGSLTIDLHGHTIDATDATAVDPTYVKNRAAFYFNGGSANPTWNICNGTIEVSDDCPKAIYACNGTIIGEDLVIKNSVSAYLAIQSGCNSATFRNVSIDAVNGGGFYAHTGRMEIFNCSVTQTGYYNHTSTGYAVANGAVLVAHNSTVNSENYGAYTFSSGGTITIYNGQVKGDGTAIMAGLSDDSYYKSRINIIGTNVVGTLVKGEQNAELNIYSGTFNNDPTAYVYSGSTVSESEGTYTVAVNDSTKTVVVSSYGTYNYPYVVNKTDVNSSDKLVSGDYALDDTAAQYIVADGYKYFDNGYWWDETRHTGFICDSQGSSSGTNAVVRRKFTRNTYTYTVYYTDFDDCLDEIDSYGTTTELTLYANCNYEGNLNSSYPIYGSSYTLTVDGNVTGGTYSCKISANAITGGTFNAAVTTENGGITGGSFKVLPSAESIAEGYYVSFVNNYFVVTNDVSSFDCYYVNNNVNVYGAYTTIYNKGNLTLTKNVETTVANYYNYSINLNGHTFTLDSQYYTAVPSKDGTNVLIVYTSSVTDNKLNFGYYYPYNDLTNYNFVEGASLVHGYYEYIVRSDDLNSDGKLYKGVYTFSISNGSGENIVLADGYSTAYAKDTNNNARYLVGQNITTLDYKVTSGVFNFDPTEYVYTGKVNVNESEGVWTVTIDESQCVAKIGDVKYLTIGSAINSATAGQTVELLGDTTVSNYINFNKNVTLDLQGYTITADQNTSELFAVNTYSARIENGTIICSGFAGNCSYNYRLYLEDINLTCTTLFTRYYKLLTVESGVYNQNVTSYVASGSSISYSEETQLYTVTKN